MEITHISSILGTLMIYALVVPIPGPSMVIISRTSIINGRQAGMAAALGTTFGVMIYAIATLLGLSTLLLMFPWMLILIQVLGGGYLVYLGLMLINANIKKQHNRASEEVCFNQAVEVRHLPSKSKAFYKGFYITMGNPKMATFFFGLFSPVVGNSDNRVTQFIVLVGVILIDFVYHQLLARMVSQISYSFDKSHAKNRLDTVVGGIMTVFGGGLIVNAILIIWSES